MAIRFKKQHKQEGLMDTLTVDVRNLPDERVRELERLIERWKQAAQARDRLQPIVKRKVHPSEFIVKKSHIIGGKLTRAMAYEDDL